MTRTIKLTDKAYAALAAQKRDRESFSAVILRNFLVPPEKKVPLSSFLGLMKGDKEMEKIYAKILKDRHRVPARSIDWETRKYRRS